MIAVEVSRLVYAIMFEISNSRVYQRNIKLRDERITALEAEAAKLKTAIKTMSADNARLVGRGFLDGGMILTPAGCVPLPADWRSKLFPTEGATV
jgi:hypothetical protein